MVNMEFNSQVCTTMDQSKRLLALGLKKETADMCWTLRESDREGNEYSVKYMSIGKGEYQMMHPNWYTPAWSLHRLIEMLPQEVIVSGTEYKLSIDSYLCIEYISEELSNPIKYFWKGNMFDRIICCIEWLIKEDYFNREYLDIH